jgi:hypothetical protein
MAPFRRFLINLGDADPAKRPHTAQQYLVPA